MLRIIFCPSALTSVDCSITFATLDPILVREMGWWPDNTAFRSGVHRWHERVVPAWRPVKGCEERATGEVRKWGTNMLERWRDQCYRWKLCSRSSRPLVEWVLLGSLLGLAAGCSYLLLVGSFEGASASRSTMPLIIVTLLCAGAIYLDHQQARRNSEPETRDASGVRGRLEQLIGELASFTPSVNLHDAMLPITRRLADAVDAARCSTLMIFDRNLARGFVLASSDDPDLEMRDLDLSRYPEVQAALRQGRPIQIGDVDQCELLEPHLQELQRLQFRSLLILPIALEDSPFGTLVLRVAWQRYFDGDAVALCHDVAWAVESFLKQSMHSERLQRQARNDEYTAARLRSLLDSSPDIMLCLDSEGRIQEANRTLEAASGLTREDLLNSSFTSIIRGIPSLPELRKTLSESEGPLMLDANVHTSGMGDRDLTMRIDLARDSTRELVLVARDITEDKRTVTRLQQTERLTSIGGIVAGVAHELNNPLTGILGFSQMLARRDTEGRFSHDLERILECALRCQKIVKNLLCFARASSPEKKSLGLNGVLIKALDLLEYTFREDEIEIVKDLDAELPYVRADFRLMQQVIMNLVTNAVHAIRSNRKQGRLVFRSRAQADRVILDISDNGPGIPPEIQSQIFDPFFTTKADGRGTGLGLSISYGIVSDHGGALTFKSRPGEGTTFSISLPVASPLPSMAEESNEDATHRVSILVADDEPVVLDLLLRLLSSPKYSVDTASNGLEALRKITARPYDLILTDIKMPKLTGIQVYEKAISVRPELKDRFVFLTGDVRFLSEERDAMLANCSCLMKPLSIEKIETAIEAVLCQDSTSPPEASSARPFLVERSS